MFVLVWVVFFFNDTATTEIYTLSLHDALPISAASWSGCAAGAPGCRARSCWPATSTWSGRYRRGSSDRKSTRLNSSHANISYAVFCLKKKITQAEIVTYQVQSQPQL